MTTLKKRLGYVFIGFVSGVLLSILTVIPVCAIYLRTLGDFGSQYWMLLVLPLCFSGVIAVWGFISTSRMVDIMSYWWSVIMEACSR